MGAALKVEAGLRGSGRQHGFSLLELLVVLAIAGLMTGLAVAWLDSSKASVEQALQRLAAHVYTQAALARHAGQLRGLRWTGTHPEFVRREGDGWVVEAVSLGDWPKGLRPDWHASAQPHLLFTPQGWAQPGSVRWRWAEGSQRWQWERDGQLRTVMSP
ncbi:type II secretion system minor pseudopilin GspH [Pseudomonas sp. NC26]|uniref:type II secretion system minor pseudopilin GspH n=1 Tax=unclassified Pseudomonas TaxID=196821 RepID=UPI0006D42ED7|nr:MULTISPECIES: type II secretion system minor pseudopilin GspH [unclassified Pseudomonas]MEC4874396.1 type II secretion system minor pseudopilin GspH [Pseudomonas sp. NC26]